VHAITSYIDYQDGIVWQATYFGLGIFDGARWKGYFMQNSGLIGDFIMFVRAHNGVGWLCTDRGLSNFDGTTWHSYRRTDDGRGEVIITDADGSNRKVIKTSTGPSHSFIIGVDFQGDDVWIATSDGVSRGVPDRNM
jgi:hypothetical protein